MTDLPIWYVFVGVLLVAVLAAGIGLLVIQRLRRRGGELRTEMAGSPVFANDRAHNKIRLARGELALLERDGRPVPAAEALLERAETMLERRDNIEAVRLALQAHELLVTARRETTTPSTAQPTLAAHPSEEPYIASATPIAGGGPALGGRGPSSTMSAGPTPNGNAGTSEDGRPPKNRMEAHFQMTLLVEELTLSTRGHESAPAAVEAEGLRSDAQRAYSSGNYTEALRLALKGRRRLGARLETLPPGRSSDPTASGQVEAVAAGPTSSGRADCPRCRRPIAEGDRFSRGCGAPRTAAVCPRCQAPVTGDDTFCGRCGSPLA